MIIRSLCRGEPRKTSAPKREISKREALIDIISIAQQASPNAIGQMEFLRPQLITLSSVVVNDARLQQAPVPRFRYRCGKTARPGRWPALSLINPYCATTPNDGTAGSQIFVSGREIIA